MSVSVPVNVCGCAGQSSCKLVSRCFPLNLPLVHIATFNVSLELQGGECSDQLTLICRHSDVPIDPNWIHNGTVESGQVLATAFPGAVYTAQTQTEHTTTITGVDNVRALDGYLIQCVYSVLGNLTKSNAVKYSFIPSGQCGFCVLHACIVGMHAMFICTYVIRYVKLQTRRCICYIRSCTYIVYLTVAGKCAVYVLTLYLVCTVLYAQTSNQS